MHFTTPPPLLANADAPAKHAIFFYVIPKLSYKYIFNSDLCLSFFDKYVHIVYCTTTRDSRPETRDLGYRNEGLGPIMVVYPMPTKRGPRWGPGPWRSYSYFKFHYKKSTFSAAPPHTFSLHSQLGKTHT